MEEKLGLFGLLLKDAYEETIHIDVVKMKRDKMLMRLDILKDACKQKQYDKANFILLDICDKILNDPYTDEYDLKFVEVDMIIFASSIMSIAVKHFDRIRRIITGLIMKYRNPVFHFVLGVSYFYNLSFQDAKKQFIVVIQLLSDHKNLKFTWPETDVLIIAVHTDKLRENAVEFLTIVKAIQKTRNVPRTGRSDSVECIEITKCLDSTIDLNVGVGDFIQHQVYPTVRTVLAEILKFDKSKLPAEYQKIVSKIVCEGNNKEQKFPNKQENADSKPEKGVTKRKATQTDAEQKKTDGAATVNDGDNVEKPVEPTKQRTTSCSSEKSVTKKHQAVQTQVNTKCKQVQTSFKTASQGTQTETNNGPFAEKKKQMNEQQEIISNLKMKLGQVTQKLNNTESKLNKELEEKNNLLAQQEETIASLRAKFSKACNKQKETETRMNKLNNKVSDLTKTNKSLTEQIETFKKTITDLRNYGQILEKKEQISRKATEDAKMIQRTLFDKYKALYFTQIQHYDGFHKRCENVVRVLNSINEYLTEITVPTKQDCEFAIREWLSIMVSCSDTIQTSTVQYRRCDSISTDEILNKLDNLPPLAPIKQPNDIVLESIPILIYTIRDFQCRLQNSEKMKENNKEINESFNFSSKTDYRKKSNYIHETGQPSTWNSNSFFTHEASNVGEATSQTIPRTKSENDGANGNTSMDTSNRKLKGLLAYLKKNIPLRAEAQIIEALNCFRQYNNGSLSGISVQYILYNVVKILDTPEKAWSTVKPNIEDMENEMEVCPICIDPINMKPKTVLGCNHVYHTECIREWLSVNRVCAVCRMHTVLDEDFPPLNNAI